MCTLIVIHRRIPGAPLVVAANRDEFYNREAMGPALFSLPGSDGVSVLAPRDCQAGGTWLGINRHQVFAAVTNRPGGIVEPSRRSRGLMVLDALRFESAKEAAEEFESIPNDRYNGFNLVVADTRDAFAVTREIGREAGKLGVRRLEPGTHVVGNAAPDDLSHPKTRRIMEAAKNVEELPTEAVFDALSEICRDHSFNGRGGAEKTGAQNEPLGNVCVHHEEYGTRSSVLLRLADGNRTSVESSMHYSDGAPCEHPFLDFTPLLSELSHTASYSGEELMARNTV
jgi:uncharacterized protein with NRDE domain